jgi:hypothetical protein
VNKPIAIFLLFSLISGSTFSQDVEKTISDIKDIFKQDPLSITGGIGSSFVFYDAKGIKSRRDPFYWALNGNLNISILGKISCPFTFTMTQQDKKLTNGLNKFSQPFNQFGLSPHYKWLTLHAGFRSMEFSEYSLNGTLFLGGGIEVKPEKRIISGSAAFGRFLKAIPTGGLQGVTVGLPAFERWGGAIKLKVGTDANYGELVYFNAKDNVRSIPFDTSNNISPSENQIFGITTAQRILKVINVQGSFHYSMYTANTYLPISKIERFTYINKIYNPRASSRYNSAANLSIDWDFVKFKIGGKFKRIDPDYASLGSLFIANDVQEVSATFSSQLFNKKVSLSLNLGTMRNNLDQKQIATQRRIAGSGNLNYLISKNWNASFGYNSFSSNTIAIQDVFYDSIKLIQVNETSTFSTVYNFGNTLKQSVNLNATYQESGGNKQALNTLFLFNPAYNLSITKLDLTFTLSSSFTQNRGLGLTTTNFGPGFGITKSFLKKKIKVNVNGSFQGSQQQKVKTNENYVLSSSISYSPHKSHSLKINYAFLNKKAIVVGAQEFTENRLTINYNYTFGLSAKKIIEKRKKSTQNAKPEKDV